MTRKVWNFNEGGNWFTFYWGNGIFRVWFGLPSPCKHYRQDGTFRKDFYNGLR